MIQSSLRLAIGATLAFSVAASAQEAEQHWDSQLATTHHEITINGGRLKYTAREGFIPIKNNETGEVHGHFSFVSYSLDRAAGAPARPVVFIWNGGPGANSTTVHFVGFGPKRLRTSDDPAKPTPVEPGLYDNDATWLQFADLVFVDPVGTGFSRPTKPEYGSEFYNTLGDIASTGEFIRVFCTRFELFTSPIFLAGESYGTWRAAGAAEALEKQGFRVAGVILISGGVAMGHAAPDEVRTALFVVGRTATAFYHKKLDPELMRDEKATLKAARQWALDEYAPAWARRDSLSDAERSKIIAKLAYYTGVDSSAIDKKTLMMSSPQFTSTLLKDRGLTLGRYDMRVTQVADAGRGGGASAGEGASRNSLIIHYLRDTLNFRTDVNYAGMEPDPNAPTGGRGAGGPGARWNWNQGETSMASGGAAATAAGRAAVGSGDGPPGGSQPWIRRAIDLDPQMKVFVAAGEYDSLNSCADNEWLIAHVEPQFANNITPGCYGGGHMMYDTKAARFALMKDIAAWVKSSSKRASK